MKKFLTTAFVAAMVFSAAFVHAQAMPTMAPAQAAAPAIPPDQQPTKAQLAKLFEVMQIRQQVGQLMQMFPVLIQQQLRQQQKEATANLPESQRLSPEKQEAIDKLTDQYLQKAMGLYTVDEMLDDMAGIYQRHFTREDVDAYIAFYSTPAGQHLLKITPVIMQEYMPVVMQRVQERSKNLTAEFSKQLADVLKTSPSPAPATTAPAPK